MRPHTPHPAREGLLIGALAVLTVLHCAALVIGAFAA